MSDKQNTSPSFWMSVWGVTCAIGLVGAGILTGGLLGNVGIPEGDPSRRDEPVQREPDIVVEIRYR